ncbi:MCE family protein [Myxococcota bacterium]|nr:MCE family protein [Myxococcota bacterium]
MTSLNKRWGIEARVGGLFLTALVLLVAFVLLLGGYSLKPGFPLCVDFSYAGGLQVGAPVKVSGIKVGRITSMEILSAQSKPNAAATVDRLGQRDASVIRAWLRLEEPGTSFLRSDALFTVAMQGVIGEAYIEMTPGYEGAALQEGVALRGVDAPKLQAMALDLQAMLAIFRDLFGSIDQDVWAGLGAALKNLSESAAKILESEGETLQAAIVDIAAATHNIRILTDEMLGQSGQVSLGKSAREASASANQALRDLPELMARARTSLAALESAAQNADTHLKSKEFEAILADAAQAIKKLDSVGSDAQVVLRHIRRGEGSVGALVQDPQVFDDLKELLADLRRNPWKLFWRD